MNGALPPGIPVLQHGSPTSSPAPAANLGWYRRFLPHLDEPGLIQFITYRLADSLPQAVLDQLAAELADVPDECMEYERRRRLEAWLDAGYGSCVLRIPAAARIVIDAWHHFDRGRYDVLAYVMMPNHVHVLVHVRPGQPLWKIVQSWKSFTGRRILELLDEMEGTRAGARGSQGEMEESRAGARGSQEERGEARAGARGAQGAQWAQGGVRHLWMREYWDRFIRDEIHFAKSVDYILQNPVKAGLVQQAHDWPWSNAASAARQCVLETKMLEETM